VASSKRGRDYHPNGNAPRSWDITDLLGRHLGEFTAGPEKMMFKIQASSGTRLFGISPGPYATLEHAIDQIGRYVQGRCRVIG
jgi:hypothetical protein